jgi:hypothetical protein
VKEKGATRTARKGQGAAQKTGTVNNGGYVDVR